MKESSLTIVSFFMDSAALETAVSSNFTLINIATETAVGPTRIAAQQEALGEKLSGQTGKLFERITEWQPVLMIFDLANTAVPWQRWIPTLKTSPATRRFPILSVGATDALLKEAKRVGSNYVVDTEAFVEETAVYIQKYARIPDQDSLISSCAEPLPDLVVEGLELFNQGEFYKCHDALEEAWMADKSAGRNLYRGVLQIGIAYFQIERGNYRGAVKMLMRVRQWLDPLPDTCRGINVADLRQNAAAVQQAITNLGPKRISEFDKSLFKPVVYEQE